MDNATRLQYLSAIGIDVWTPRYAQEPEAITEHPEDSWEALNAEMAACQQCDLCQARRQVVLGSGNQQADWLWITEAPNEMDEQQGMPFADDSAELFAEMLRAMQLSKDELFITHIVKCRPPEDRDPKSSELLACEAFLERQIALVQPKLIIAVGRIAAHKLLASKAPLGELRETVHEFSGIPLLVMYHPAYLLRALSEKRKAWQDMRRAITLFDTVKNNNDKTNIQ